MKINKEGKKFIKLREVESRNHVNNSRMQKNFRKEVRKIYG